MATNSWGKTMPTDGYHESTELRAVLTVTQRSDDDSSRSHGNTVGLSLSERSRRVASGLDRDFTSFNAPTFGGRAIYGLHQGDIRHVRLNFILDRRAIEEMLHHVPL